MSESDRDLRALRVLWVGGGPCGPIPGCEFDAVRDASAAAARARDGDVDAVVIEASAEQARALARDPEWAGLLLARPVIGVAPDLPPAEDEALIAAGYQDLLTPAEATPDALARRIRRSVLRKSIECAARNSWSTDLGTGLPTRAQLLEHLNQLIAMQARVPVTLAVVAVRVEGLDAVTAAYGAEAAQIVRRKVAVRLRAAVRASDVVASLGDHTFALLLSKIETADDARRVAAKIEQALREPFSVMGTLVAVSARLGIALSPGDADQAERLLHHAQAQALAAARTRLDAANSAAD